MASVTTQLVMAALLIAILRLVVTAVRAARDGRRIDVELIAPFAALSIHVDAARPDEQSSRPTLDPGDMPPQPVLAAAEPPPEKSCARTDSSIERTDVATEDPPPDPPRLF